MSYLFALIPTARRRRAACGRPRRLVAAAAAAGVLLTLAGCTNSSESTAASSAMSTSAAAAPAAAAAGAGSAADETSASSAAAATSGAPSSAAAGSAGAPTPASGSASGTDGVDIGAEVDAQDRQVIRTANLTLNVVVKSSNTTAAADEQAEEDAVEQKAQDVRNLATGTGYVSAAQGKGTTQSITLRVPAAGYDNVITALQRIAPIVSRQETTEDVTSKMVDIGSRMQTMTASVNRVRALLSKAEKIGDVIAIESELSSREADLESLQRQQAALAGQTALSTITVVVQGSITGVKPKVAPVAPPPPAARSGFTGGLANGWDAVRHIGHAGLTVVGTLLPFVPVVAVLLLIGLYLRRRIRRQETPVRPSAGDPQPAE